MTMIVTTTKTPVVRPEAIEMTLEEEEDQYPHAHRQKKQHVVNSQQNLLENEVPRSRVEYRLCIYVPFDFYNSNIMVHIDYVTMMMVRKTTRTIATRRMMTIGREREMEIGILMTTIVSKPSVGWETKRREQGGGE